MAAGVVAQTLVSGFFRKQLKQQKPRCFHKRLVFYVSGGGEKQPQLAYLEPVAKGLHLTHWSSGDVAAQTLQEGIVPAVSARTVRRILREVDLQPHRTRYWKTSRLNDQFKRRAEQILWCYGNAQRLADQGWWIVCTDEIPNCQVLERHPIRHALPGLIEQQEFEYKRHGTVTILVFLVVHTGRMPELK